MSLNRLLEQLEEGGLIDELQAGDTPDIRPSTQPTRIFTLLGTTHLALLGTTHLALLGTGRRSGRQTSIWTLLGRKQANARSWQRNGSRWGLHVDPLNVD